MGYTYSEVVQDTAGNALVGVQVTMWTARTGGTQVTSLTTVAGSPISYATSTATGLIEWVETTQAWSMLWMQPPSGSRRPAYATDALGSLAATAATAAAAAAAADAAATAAATAQTTAEAADARSTEALALAVAEQGINARAMGAVGDGVTDDTEAIQTALDAGAGAVVIIPAGDYLISSRLVVSAGTLVWGYGATLHRGGALTSTMLGNYPPGDTSTTGYDGAGGIVIAGLTMDSHGDAPGAASGNVLTFCHARHITVRDCTFRRPKGYHSIELNSTSGALIDNCRFLGYVVDAALTLKEAVQIDVAAAGSAPSGATDGTLSEHITVRGCKFAPDEYGNPAHQVGVGSHTTYAGGLYSDIRVIDCTGTSMGTALVRAYYWSGMVAGCVADAPGSYGVRAESSQRLTISECTVTSAPSAGASITGSVRVAVTGGYYDSCGNGVAILTGSSRCHVDGVRVRRPASGSGQGYGVVLDNASDTLVSGCLIDGAGYTGGASGAIRVSDASGGCVRTSIAGCRTLLHGAGTEVSAGVSVAAGSTDTWVFGCDFKGLAAATSGTVNTTSNRI
jgi:hypothetical protein